MNKVVRREMLAGDLPPELRGDIDPGERVKVEVEVLPDASAAEQARGHFSRHFSGRAELFATVADVNEHVRALREEWDPP